VVFRGILGGSLTGLLLSLLVSFLDRDSAVPTPHETAGDGGLLFVVRHAHEYELITVTVAHGERADIGKLVC